MSVVSPGRWWKLGCRVLMGVLCLSGCSGEENRRPAAEPIRIGALYPLSGAEAKTGEDLKAGLEVALQVINQSCALSLPAGPQVGLPAQGGRKLELVFRDTRSDPVVASVGLDELVSQEKVVAVIGCYHSGVTALASEQAEMRHVPFLNADSTSPVLTQRSLKWFFRITPDDWMFSRDFFEFLGQMREKNRLPRSCPLALVYEDGLWGTNVAQAQQRLAREQGYRIAADVPYSASAGSFEEELRRIEGIEPAVILQASYERDALAFMKGYRSRSVQPVAILAMDAGFVSPEFIPTLGPDAENVLSREVWAVDLSEKRPLIKEVNALFRSRYQRNMTGNSARSFTGLMVLADAINRAHRLSPEAVRKALLQTDMASEQLIMPWEGIRFDPDTGQNVLGKGIIVQVQQGRYVTVWPEALAVSSPIWPPSTCLQEK
jgi:branched-chain amino acid transport system substrate-binding protein